MAVSTGYVTVTASDGGHVVAITTDAAGLTLASSFLTMTAQFAAAAGAYSGTGYFAAGNSTGATLGTVTPSGFSSILVGDGATLSYGDTVNGAAIVSGNGNDTIVAAGANDTIDAGAGSNTLVLGGSTANVTTAGNDTIAATNVGLNYTNDAASGVIDLYGGTMTMSGAGISDVYANSATITVMDSGTDTFVFNQATQSGAAGSSVLVNASAATGNESFWAGSGNVTLVGGSGNDTFAGGAGAATITAGTGANAIALFNEDATASTMLTVSSFSAHDYIGLVNFSASTTYSINQTGGNDVLTLSNGSTITLVGYTDLTSAEIRTNNGLPTQTT